MTFSEKKERVSSITVVSNNENNDIKKTPRWPLQIMISKYEFHVFVFALLIIEPWNDRYSKRLSTKNITIVINSLYAISFIGQRYGQVNMLFKDSLFLPWNLSWLLKKESKKPTQSHQISLVTLPNLWCLTQGDLSEYR